MKTYWMCSALAVAAISVGCSKSEPPAPPTGSAGAPPKTVASAPAVSLPSAPSAPAAPPAAPPAAMTAPAGDAPDAYVQGLLKAVGTGDAGTLWNALPPKYQADVNGLKNEFAAKMDPDLWNKSFSVAGKLGALLKDKKAMLLASPLGMQIPPPIKPLVESNWDAVSAGLNTLVLSEIKTLEGLKSTDPGKFLGSTGSVLASGIMKAAMSANPDDAAKFNTSKVVLVKQEGDTATLKLEVPGKEGPQEEKVFKKVDGKWLPADMVDGWEKTITDAKTELSGITITPEMKAQFNGAVGMIEPVLDKLLAAKDQAAFDGEVQGLLAIAAMFGGGPPGGGAMQGPPGGAPPGGLPGGPLPGGVIVPPATGPGGLPNLPPSGTPVIPPTTTPAPTNP